MTGDLIVETRRPRGRPFGTADVWTEVRRAAFKKDWDAGMSQNNLAEKYGIKPHTVRNFRMRFGLTARPHYGVRKKKATAIEPPPAPTNLDRSHQLNGEAARGSATATRKARARKGVLVKQNPVPLLHPNYAKPLNLKPAPSVWCERCRLHVGVGDVCTGCGPITGAGVGPLLTKGDGDVR